MNASRIRGGRSSRLVSPGVIIWSPTLSSHDPNPPITINTGQPTLIVGAGTYGLTGGAVSLKLGRVVGVGSGSYALTGTNAGLRKAIPLVAATGSYALSGSTVNLLVSRRIDAATSSYAMAGTAVNLLKGIVMIVAPGSYILSGSDADLVVGTSSGGKPFWTIVPQIGIGVSIHI